MKHLWTPVNLIFVIAEVGTLSQKQLHMFKTEYKDGHFGGDTILTTFSPKTLQVVVIWSIRVYQPPIDKDGGIAAGDIQIIPELMPFSIFGSTNDMTTVDGLVIRGHEYFWCVTEGMSIL